MTILTDKIIFKFLRIKLSLEKSGIVGLVEQRVSSYFHSSLSQVSLGLMIALQGWSFPQGEKGKNTVKIQRNPLRLGTNYA